MIMVPTLHIDKVDSSLYLARLLDGEVEMGEPSAHGTIAEALVHAGEAVPKNLAAFVEVWYVDVSIGMHTLARLKTDADGLAHQLVALAAAVRDAEEELQRSP